MEFVVPAKLEDLTASVDGAVSVKERTDVSALSAEEAEELVERACAAPALAARAL